MPSNEILLHDIRQRMDYEAFFREFLPSMRRSGREFVARCIWHEDSNPSMSINVQDGLYFCHVPSCGAHGDFITFYRRRTSTTFREALEYFANRVGLDYASYTSPSAIARMHAERVASTDEDALIERYRASLATRAEPQDEQPPSTIDEAIVAATHANLLANDEWVQWLETERLITRDTIARFNLGHDGQRYYIPIRDAENNVVNIRRYRPGADADAKMISWRPGYGAARLWPLSSLDRGEFSVEQAPEIFILEGEWDTLLACQQGLHAVTSTSGAGAWRDAWSELFRGRHVNIVYDCDEAGRVGALNVARSLHGVAAEIRVVDLRNAFAPNNDVPSGFDYTDYMRGTETTPPHLLGDLHTLVNYTAPFVLEDAATATPNVDEAIELHLSHASRAEYYNRPIRIPVMVSGKTTAPYIVPETIRMTCPDPDLKMCQSCPLHGNGERSERLDFRTNEILQFINVDDDRMQRKIKEHVGVPQKCSFVETEIQSTLNIEELQVIPEIDRTDQESTYVTRAIFYVGHGLQANRNYMLSGITVPEPKKQFATHLIHAAIPAQSNIDAFLLSDDVKMELRAFQETRFMTGIVGGTTEYRTAELWRQLDLIYDDIERVTRIYQRRDLMLTVDLTLHSPLAFVFQGELLVRGWVESLIIGDSRTGKTTIVARMFNHYAAGEFSTGENTSIAGLVGGLHQVGTSWALSWGRIPLNDRRALAIDEASNLLLDHIARMSSMRSSGIAEITKIHTERTNARTRQIWISNPRSPRPLSTFSQGVLAVKELIGAPEDIARFDLVCTAASTDVTLDVINAERGHTEPSRFTSHLCHQRLMWAWSRKPHQIMFTEAAAAKVLEHATTQGHKYRHSTEIPLVEPNEQRIKLARLAVSAATIFYSTDDSGENIVVGPEHVQFAYEFLERLYAKPSLAFDEYSRMQNARFELTNEDEIKRIITRSPLAARALMEQELMTQRDLQEILGVSERDDLRAIASTLRESGFLKRVGSSYYVKTSGAISWLRNYLALSSGRGGAVASFSQNGTSTEDHAEIVETFVDETDDETPEELEIPF